MSKMYMAYTLVSVIKRPDANNPVSNFTDFSASPRVLATSYIIKMYPRQNAAYIVSFTMQMPYKGKMGKNATKHRTVPTRRLDTPTYFKYSEAPENVQAKNNMCNKEYNATPRRMSPRKSPSRMKPPNKSVSKYGWWFVMNASAQAAAVMSLM